MVAASSISIVAAVSASASSTVLRSVSKLAVTVGEAATPEVVAAFLLLGELDVDRSALELGVVGGVARGASLVLALELDEGDALVFGAVHGQVAGLDRAELLEVPPNVLLLHRELQVLDEELPCVQRGSRRRLLPSPVVWLSAHINLALLVLI